MSHPYAALPAFDRLLLLIATFTQYPGVGRINPLDWESDAPHDPLQEVLIYLRRVANELNIEISDYSRYTIQSDLKTLRRYGLLQERKYRWGYYLGAGTMNREELQVALNALHSQAKYQKDPQISQIYRQIYQRLTRRLGGVTPKDELFYPVRTHLDRVVVHTDPLEMMEKSCYRGTLFEQLESLERAIAKGQAIELFRCRNPYHSEGKRYEQVYPLQLIYSDIAWYLLQEDYKDGHLFISRLDRFSEHLGMLDKKGRGTAAQWKNLQTAHHLLEAGWGLYLGSREEQQREIQGELELLEIRVRFFPEVMEFIREGEKRHPHQEIKLGPKGKDGRLEYVEYLVKLPNRSLDEFCRWVYRFMGNAQFIYPESLAQQHQEFARTLVARYCSEAP